MGRIRNSKGGTSIAELGPALFVLVIVVMIPVCDLLALLCSYTAGWLLNTTMVRECAVKNPTNSGATPGISNIKTAVQIADGTWKGNVLISGLAQARNATTIHKIIYTDNLIPSTAYNVTFTVSPSGTAVYDHDPAIPKPISPPVHPPAGVFIAACQVVTTLPVQPLFIVPFIGNVPGLSSAVNFVYSAQRPQEEKGFQ